MAGLVGLVDWVYWRHARMLDSGCGCKPGAGAKWQNPCRIKPLRDAAGLASVCVFRFSRSPFYPKARPVVA